MFRILFFEELIDSGLADIGLSLEIAELAGMLQFDSLEDCLVEFMVEVGEFVEGEDVRIAEVVELGELGGTCVLMELLILVNYSAFLAISCW